MFHNTVITGGNVRLSIEFRFATSGGEVRNNLADAPIGSRNGGTYSGSGNYLAAETTMFVDPVAGDLHLLDTSATRANIIDRGTTLTAAPLDIDGETRPLGSATDIGADEFSLAYLPGDVNGDGELTLVDAVVVLQVLTGNSPLGVHLEADVNGDGRIGLPEVIHILEQLAHQL